MPVVITLGGRPCVDAIEEARNLTRLGYPAPPEFARANSLLNPRGEHPARGWVLMLKSNLDLLNLNALLTLTMTDAYGNSVTVKNLVIAREPTCITPSYLGASDADACYLVEVADARWRCHNPYYSVSLDQQYNVRAPGWRGLYYEATTNAGVAWTWTQLVGDIWAILSTQLGVYPGFPLGFVPDGVPERYRFVGISAWRALNQVLGKLGLAVVWNATKATYVIVQVGATDAAATRTLKNAADSQVFDRIFPAVVRGRVPAGVTVYFHRVQEDYGTEPATAQDDSQFVTENAYGVDIAASAAIVESAEPGTLHPLWDDLPALYDAEGVLTNEAALLARAQARANAYYAAIQGAGGGRRQQIYTGLVNIAPGSTISGVCWRQDLSSLGDPAGDGGGLVTEIVATPAMQLRVSDNGQFEEALPDSSALHPPDLRVKEPVWPDLLQMVRVTSAEASSASSTSGDNDLYPGIVLAWDSDLQLWIERETCWVLSSNGEALVERNYRTRLVGNVNGLPVYATEEGALIAQINGSSSVSGSGEGFWDATIQQYDPVAGWLPGIKIWLVDAND